MSFSLSEYTKIDVGWGFAPDPTGGAYSAPLDHLTGLRGPASKGRGGEVTGGEGLWTITMLETDSLGKTNERAI